MGINAPEKVEGWAYDDLQSSDKTWKLGAYHFPIYPVMPEGQNDDGYPWLRRPIEQGRLDILFEGHEHSFARTFPTKGDELFDRPSEARCTISWATAAATYTAPTAKRHGTPASTRRRNAWASTRSSR